MYKKIIFLLVYVTLFFSTSAQPSKFTKQEFFDDFNDSSIANWSVKNDADNLYLIDKGNYQLYRKNNKNSDIIFCRWENALNNFELHMNFRFEKNKNKDQYAGFVFKAGRSDALLAEFNANGTARIRLIEEGKPVNISGGKKDDGWIKCKGLKSDYNLFVLQSDSDSYTLYINGIRAFTQFIPGYMAGRMGITIGPDTKISIDNLRAFSEPRKRKRPTVPDDENPVNFIDTAVAHDNPNANKTDSISAGKAKQKTVKTGGDDIPNPKTTSNDELVELQNKIFALQLQLNLFRNKMYQEQDRADSLQEILTGDGKRDYREENKRLQRELSIQSRLNDSLFVLLRTYNDVRAVMNKTDGNNVSTKLATKLREEKARNYELEKRNKELEVQNKKLTLQQKSMEADIEKLKSQQSKKKE